LIKYAKGYGWEVKNYCDDMDKALEEVKRIDDKLRALYGTNGTP